MTNPESLFSALRTWLELPHEDRVMTLVEDGSFSEYVRMALDIADEAALVREVARRGHGYGWATFDALVRKAKTL